MAKFKFDILMLPSLDTHVVESMQLANRLFSSWDARYIARVHRRHEQTQGSAQSHWRKRQYPTDPRSRQQTAFRSDGLKVRLESSTGGVIFRFE
jgi:hypothetical protein